MSYLKNALVVRGREGDNRNVACSLQDGQLHSPQASTLETVGDSFAERATLVGLSSNRTTRVETTGQSLLSLLVQYLFVHLQAHREVFDCLIEKFTTYKPILAAIKKEYDLFISHQNEVIRELLPLQVSEHVHIVCLKRLLLGIAIVSCQY